MLAKKKVLDIKKKGLSEKKLAEIRFFAGSPIKPRWHRILVEDLNKPFRVHNGKRLIGVFAKDFMVGLKFGEFVFSRKVSDSVHSRLSKSKKSRK